MEFKFNFSLGDTNVGRTPSPSTNEFKERSDGHKGQDKRCGCQILKVCDIVTNWSSKSSSDFYNVNEFSMREKDLSFFVVGPSSESTSIKDFEEGTDLVPAVYEGGFKVWECTRDLIGYLQEQDAPTVMKDKTVLDVGCGVGLLALYALICGDAAHVTLQDYNADVVKESAGPTCLFNLWRRRHCGIDPHDGEREPAPTSGIKSMSNLDNTLLDWESVLKDESFLERAANKLDFLTGDWGELANFVEIKSGAKKYDVVLTSETIYNVSNYIKLHDFLSAALSSDGVAYVASKSHYFGVGGGVATWRDFVNSRETFEIEVVSTVETNLQRKVLRMKFKKLQTN